MVAKYATNGLVCAPWIKYRELNINLILFCWNGARLYEHVKLCPSYFSPWLQKMGNWQEEKKNWSHNLPTTYKDSQSAYCSWTPEKISPAQFFLAAEKQKGRRAWKYRQFDSWGWQFNFHLNRPFDRCVLSCLAFEWKRGWSWPCFDRDLPTFLMSMFLPSC